MRALVYHIYTTTDEIHEVRTMKQRDDKIAELRAEGIFRKCKEVLFDLDEQRNILYPVSPRGARASIIERKKVAIA